MLEPDIKDTPCAMFAVARGGSVVLRLNAAAAALFPSRLVFIRVRAEKGRFLVLPHPPRRATAAKRLRRDSHQARADSGWWMLSYDNRDQLVGSETQWFRDLPPWKFTPTLCDPCQVYYGPNNTDLDHPDGLEFGPPPHRLYPSLGRAKEEEEEGS